MNTNRLPIVILNNALWYMDNTLRQLRKVDNPHEFADYSEHADLVSDPGIWLLQGDEPNLEAVVIGVDNDHSVINANPTTGEVWNNGGHFTDDDTFTDTEQARIEACLTLNPFFDFHTASNAEQPAVVLFNSLADGTQDEQICLVPTYPRAFNGDSHKALLYAEVLGEFVLEALRSYTKTDGGKAKWADLIQFMRDSKADAQRSQ